MAIVEPRCPPRCFRLTRSLMFALLVLTLLSYSILASQTGYNRTLATFTSGRSVGNNTFSTRPDWVAPTTAAAKVVNNLGNIDLLRQGGVYQVCASVSDTGAPPSGVASVKADMAVGGSVVTTGQSAAMLTAGNFTCGGVAYDYQSGMLTADNPQSQGSKTFSITTVDGAANAASSSWNVTLDNTAPTATGFQTVNTTGGTVGRAQVGDSILLTYSEDIHLPSVKAGWDGSATAVVVTINNNVVGSGNSDTVTFDVNLGTINLGANNYTSAPNSVFAGSMVWSAATNRIAITLTSLTVNRVNTGASSTATYVPNGAIQDLAGNGISTASQPTESGKRHF